MGIFTYGDKELWFIILVFRDGCLIFYKFSYSCKVAINLVALADFKDIILSYMLLTICSYSSF